MPEENEDAITDAITENATGPLRAQGDQGSVEMHPLSEQIAADRYVKSKNAARSGLGIRCIKLIPEGAD